MNSTTETTDATPVAGSDTPAADALSPLTFARDRRKYTRFLDPLHTGPGLQLFESPEHEAFGDGLWFVDADGNQFQQSPPSTNYFPTPGNQSFSFGQVMALAGDFYGIPSQPISDGVDAADQQTRFMAAFNTLWTEPFVPFLNTSQALGILAVMQQQSDAVSLVAGNILATYPNTTDAWSQAYSQTNADDQFDIAYNDATGASPAVPWWSSEGRYLQLAAVNWDHFGANAIAAYQAGHTLALQTAATGDYMQAYALEAFACHYLTDLFSSGHLRTPRKALHTANRASDLCSRLMHDEDCYNGLVVQNANGDSWTAYGDKRLNDPPNHINFTIAQAAVQMSLEEVVNAVTTRDPAPVFGALSLIPTLSAVTDRLNPANWSPLYVVDNGAPKVRDELNDLTCRLWTSNFLYISTYSRVPAGGVHSIDGAPPGQGAGPAHALAWQSHRIIGSSEDDLAPSAAVVTLSTNVGNTAPTGQFSGTAQENTLNTALQNFLCVVFRKTSSDSSNHHLHFLAIPMTDAPAFKIYTPTEVSFGGASKHATDGGDPAVVAMPGALLMVYPDSSGALCQATWSASLQTWSTQGSGGALSSTDSANYKLLAPPGGDVGPRVALCNVNSQGLYMAYPSRNLQAGGNVVFSTWNPSKNLFNTPFPVVFTGANGSLTATRTSASVSLTEFDGTLLLAFVNANGNNSICILQISGGEVWSLFSPIVMDTVGQIVTTHSALSLVTYGGLLMLAVNDANGNITTYAWRPTSRNWSYYQIQGTSNGNKTIGALQTKFALSPVSYEGDAYVVFTDKANGAPSIMTTATTVVQTS